MPGCGSRPGPPWTLLRRARVYRWWRRAALGELVSPSGRPGRNRPTGWATAALPGHAVAATSRRGLGRGLGSMLTCPPVQLVGCPAAAPRSGDYSCLAARPRMTGLVVIGLCGLGCWAAAQLTPRVRGPADAAKFRPLGSALPRDPCRPVGSVSEVHPGAGGGTAAEGGAASALAVGPARRCAASRPCRAGHGPHRPAKAASSRLPRTRPGSWSTRPPCPCPRRPPSPILR